jgi:hypothetical protein
MADKDKKKANIDKQSTDYQRLYELAARKVDKQRSDYRKEYKADRAAGRNPKLNEGIPTVANEYRKSANEYARKNNLLEEGPKQDVLKRNTQRAKSSRIVRKGTGARVN